MRSPQKFKRTIALGALLLALSALSVAPVAGQGTVLNNFEPTVFANKPVYWPIGVTFDGTNLWYSQPSSTNPGLFLTTTTGTFLRSLSLVFPTAEGALAWDGTNLWVASFGGGSKSNLVDQQPFVFQVSTAGRGTLLKSLNLTSIFAPDNECGIIDGLAFDPSTGTLWVSPDIGCLINFTNNVCAIGFAYNIDTSGNLIRKIQFSFGVSGVAVAGKHLWAVDRCGGNIDQVDPTGLIEQSFHIVKVNPHSWAESIASDLSTFTPTQALWTVQPYNPGGNTIDSIVDNANLVAYVISNS